MEKKLWTPGGDVPVSKEPKGPAPGPEPAPGPDTAPGAEPGLPPELSEEQVAEIREALEQLRQIPVEELILNQINTLAQVAQLHLNPDELDQSRLAINSIKALIDAAGERFGQVKPQLDELVSQLQLIYVQAASAAQGEQATSGPETGS